MPKTASSSSSSSSTLLCGEGRGSPKRPFRKKRGEGEEESSPSLWTVALPPLLAALAYANSLPGDFVHDDVAAIERNGDVTGARPWHAAVGNDFWEEEADGQRPRDLFLYFSQ